ncbi:MAG: hypothetical protein NTU98_04785 [Bacteroidetes bacterium]|nr:hypothetical protein [Bacteroidota bacterium]
MKNSFLVALLFIQVIAFPQSKNGGLNTYMGDESMFYAQTKQVNQFFRRFNAEEDVKGKRTYNGDSIFRDLKSRKKYLNILFDNSGSVSTTDRDEFIERVTDKKSPVFLDFHGNDWFSEVAASFIYKHERVDIILYLKLEKQNGGFKWVFSNVYFSRFNDLFSHVGDTTNLKLFLHPLSHEVDFMNIHKVFEDPERMDYFLDRYYRPDQLSLFVSELKNGNLKFESVKGVKFHFLQVPGWYFEVSYFNRNSNNSGWLISNMIKINPKDKKELIRNYIHED